jgi:hypothetical protein
MRAPLLLAAAMAGCVSFHPLDPAHRSAAGDPGADATGPLRERGPRARVSWQTFGESHEGLPLRFSRMGRGPRRVIWIGGIHGDEREGRVATAELPHAFAAEPGALELVTLTIVEDVNPDGTAQRTRGNSRGVDLNRNYPAKNWKPNRFHGGRPLDQPEARALHDLILDERPHLVIVAHGWRGDHFINFDGPAESLARRFSEASGYRVQPSNDIAPTPGSLGSWVGGTLGIPILTLEYERGSEPWSAWVETRSAILSVILSP